ncbi:hypothetical protein BGP_1695 [Beggiatoa sp. PS]|nr:hypothetical protein BGP_1695 [Beggiatoa sp. PS]
MSPCEPCYLTQLLLSQFSHLSSFFQGNACNHRIVVLRKSLSPRNGFFVKFFGYICWFKTNLTHYLNNFIPFFFMYFKTNLNCIIPPISFQH